MGLTPDPHAAAQDARATAGQIQIDALAGPAADAAGQHALYRTLLDAQANAGIGLFIVEADRIVYANAAIRQLYGYTEAELLALPDSMALVHPDDRDRVADNYRRRIAGADFPNRYDVSIIAKNGSRRDVEVTVTRLPATSGPVGLLVIMVDVTARRHAEKVLREVVESTSRATGAEFFHTLVQHLARALDVPFAMIGEVRPDTPDKLHALAFWAGDRFATPSDCDLATAPCAAVFGGTPCLIEQGLAAQFPQTACTTDAPGAESYYGVPLTTAAGAPLGVVAIMDRQPMQANAEHAALMSMFAARAAAELERQRAEAEIRRFNAELEDRVRRRTAELTEANRELESFAYSVSHDLRAPLRGIDGFSRLLQEEYEERLDTQGKDYLVRVRRAAQRLGRLIDDLLELSRVTRHEMQHTSVDLSALANEVAAELRRSEPERTVAIDIEPSCAARGDRKLLRVLIENLLGNAWKFSRDRSQARIEFGRAANGRETVYFLRDNGAGFDMTYADKLFSPFQRLHSPTEFEGSGVGLASAARVVRRHGGRIWAESAPGEGAVFRFTLGARA